MNTTVKSLSEDATKLAQQGLDGLDSAGQRLRETTDHARQYTTDHIRHDPIKSVLIAAAVGAGLMGLLTMVANLKGAGHGHRGLGQ